MNLFKPTSPKLTELTQSRDDFKAKVVTGRAESIRLSKQLYPQWLDETVRHATYVAPHNSPPLDVSYRPDASVAHTGASEYDDSDLVRRTLAGETFQAAADTKTQLENVQRQLAAYETTIEHLSRELEHESNRLRQEYAQSLVPKHRDLMVKLSNAVVDVHAAYADVYGLKRHLVESGVGLRHKLCNTMPEFLSVPTDSYGEMASFLAAAKQHGWVKDVPQSLKMKAGK